MNVYFQGLLFALASVGLFAALNSISRPIVRALLNGPLNDIYLQYLRYSTKREFDVAFRENNVDRAWSGVLFEKVYELGISSVSYSRRERNLEYIKAEAVSRPQIRRKLANELIRILARQSRNVDFQAKLACYICELLTESRNDNSLTLRAVHSVEIDHITTAISAWIAGSVYLLFSLNFLDDYSPLYVSISNILLFVFMILPLFKLAGTSLAKITSVGLIATIIILFLSSFATISHNSAVSMLQIDLSSYQNPDVKMSLRYPGWLTTNNTNCNGKKISIALQGHLMTPIGFRVNDDRFYFTNKDCVEIAPQIEILQTKSQVYEFYIVAQDSSPFFSENHEISVIPFYISSSGNVDFDSNSTLRIRLENWFWSLVSNSYLSIGSMGATVLLYLVNILVNRRNP